jgi:hypothetical protein
MDDAPATAAVELIRHLQIQRTRLTDYMSRLRLNDGTPLILWANIDQGMRDAAEIHARVSTLFPFARGQPATSVQCNAQSRSGGSLVSGLFS